MTNRLLVCFAAGLASHVLDRPMKRIEEPYQLLARYAAGYLLTLPLAAWLMLLLMKNVNDRSRIIEQMTLAQLLAAFGVGAGVTVGHIVDRIMINGDSKT